MSPVSRSRKRSKSNGRNHPDAQQRQAKAAFLAAKRDTSAGRYWHGGRAGLGPGAILIPRAVAEREGADLAHYEAQPGYDLGMTDAERVYFSSSREFARSFAGRIQTVDEETGVVGAHGALYEVEPIGEIEKGPDFERVSWCAPRARIVSVAEHDVRLTPYEVTERTGPYTERIYIGGDLMLTEVRKNIVVTERIYRWGDQYDQWQEIFDQPATGVMARLP